MKLHISKRSGKMILLFGIALIMEFFLWRFHKDTGYALRQFLAYFILLAWGETIRRRILNERRQRLLLTICGMMQILLLAVIIKYDLSTAYPLLERYLWYFYYVTFVFIPLLVYYVADSILIEYSNRIKQLVFFLMGVILVLLVFTNDLHHLVFRFPDAAVYDRSNYSYGIVYYLIVLWSVLFFLQSVYLMMKRTYLKWEWCLFWIPILILLFGSAISLASFTPWYAEISGGSHVSIPIVFCFSVTAALESCIQTGLIPSNSDYDQLFSLSSIAAMLVHDDETVHVSSASARPLNKEQIHLAIGGNYHTDKNSEIISHRIHGGHILWKKDLTQENRINEELQDTIEQLEKENEILNKQNLFRQKRAMIDTETAIYKQVDERILKNMIYLNDLLSSQEDYPDRVREALPIMMYVKRITNIVIKEFNHEPITSSDLSYTFNDIFLKLQEQGIICSLSMEEAVQLNYPDVYAILQIYENIYEKYRGELKSILIHSELKEKKSVRFVLEGVKDLAFSDAFEWRWRIETSEEDGTVYLDYHLKGVA